MGFSLDSISLEEAVHVAAQAIAARRPTVHCSLNALKVVEARKDPAIRELLQRFDLITADGVSIVWGLRLLGGGRTEQVAGVDLMARLLGEGAGRGWRFFFLGATPEVAAGLPATVESRFAGVRIAGTQHGYFGASEEGSIVARIRDSAPDVLFVGMPSPRKERFLMEHREKLGVPFAMGVGGGLDLLAGKTRRAPVWMRRSGLEWSYRVMQEPRRLAGRYLVTNLRFAGLLAGEMIASRRPGRQASC
jgi:N-acetylglucosaminyldiphosphoundecaprenol N-acetyl-beta-D-mannosaminyltransferase